jgi:hypothetical protein
MQKSDGVCAGFLIFKTFSAKSLFEKNRKPYIRSMNFNVHTHHHHAFPQG